MFVAIARRREVSFAQIAKDFGISETCVQNWVRKAEIDDGVKPGATTAEHAENRELKKRVRLLEQENEVLRRAAAYLSEGAIPMSGPAGRVSASDNAYWTSSVSPSATLFVPFSGSLVPSWTKSTYDGAGRVVASTLGSFGDVVSTTLTQFDGSDSATVTPPSGGTPTTTITDSLNHTISLTQYLASTASGSADTEVTHYAYDQRGRMVGMTDPVGNQWLWSYDVLGRQVSATDPDTGVTTSAYDAIGNLTSSTDSRGVTLARTYDALDRPVAVYRDAPVTGSLLANWTYDTLSKGMLTSSTSYVGSIAGTPGDPYTTAVTGYDVADRPLGSTLTLPTSTPGFGAQTITGTVQYNVAGTISKSITAAIAGLPAETITYGYDVLGLPASLSTTGLVVTAANNSLGQLSNLDRTGTHRVTTAFGYDPATSTIDVIEHRYRTGTTVNQVLASTAYDRDDAGNIRSLTTTSDTTATDTQCFELDHLSAMTEAWTPADGDCDAAPTAGSLGGPAPYWQSYEVDPATGNRDGITRHGTGGDPTVTDSYSYGDPGDPHPHAVNEVTHDDGTATATDAYQYDSAGATVVRPDQEVTYDAFGRIATIENGDGDVQTRIYDASGNLLVQSDPDDGAQLFLGDTIVTKAPGASAASGSREYSLGGFAVAERNSVAGVSGTTTTWICANDQSTQLLEVAAATGVATRRYVDPFGSSRGSAVAWSSVRGFLGLPESAFADLAQLGARAYDSDLGRFVTVDPLLAPKTP